MTMEINSNMRVKDHIRNSREESMEFGDAASVTSSNTHIDSVHAQEHAMRTKDSSARYIRLVLVLVVVLGFAASASFLYLGITSTQDEEETHFGNRAAEVVQELQAAWEDYEVAGLWIHESCRSRDFTRTDFRALFEYIHSGGLDFQAAEFIPNVTREERAYVEEDDRAYYRRFHPDFEYHGFKGFEPDQEGGLTVQNRSEQPFYFPVRYVEPMESNSAAAGFDLYSSASRRATIHQALETWKPALTNRLSLVQETDPSAYSVLLMHPGVPLETTEPYLKPRDLSLLVVRIPDLLIRSSRNQAQSLGMYVYDKSIDPPQFLGAVSVEVSSSVPSDAEALDTTIEETIDVIPELHRTVEFLPEVELDELILSMQGSFSVDLKREEIEASSNTWEVIVFPIEGTYEPEYISVILAGVIIAVATIALAGCLFFNLRRVTTMNEIILQSEADKALVSNLFPTQFRQRLMNDKSDQRRLSAGCGKDGKEVSSAAFFGSEPIAELYPEATVMFADVEGFTAWSSVRDPAQVFILLESIYHSFDVIAKRRGVFKVETIGDCYVACAGLPDPRKDHALIMSRFAVDCVLRMPEVTDGLERTLGPDTSDLKLRVGLHSGPVTAGILRGDRARFQLFGDTVNTAARMEGTGQGSRVQVSESTAHLLRHGGKAVWLESETHVAKCGKGELETRYLNIEAIAGVHYRPVVKAENSDSTMATGQSGVAGNALDEKHMKLVEYNVQVLERFLRQIVVRQQASAKSKSHNNHSGKSNIVHKKFANGAITEVKDVIAMPEFDAKTVSKSEDIDPASVRLDPAIVPLLRDYTTRIASLYHPDNSFHNFDHCSHVVMSIVKLLSRIINPQMKEIRTKKAEVGRFADASDALSLVHDHTFGITSDPITQFACVFAGLIHDVDHTGLPNAVLVNEGTELARIYKDKSVAEQHSLDLAWDVFMESKYDVLRDCLFETEADLEHFRAVLVNAIMATDIMDKQLGAERKKRWEIAFAGEGKTDESSSLQKESVDRKATIVIEHLIQASDVAHTMQHWHVYRKWNQKLFLELYHAYKTGHLEKDPSISWYEGELGFFDFYLIPLAKKLETCGVFGVSSHEYLNYATDNREEWAEKGKGLVASYLNKYNGLSQDEADDAFVHELWV